jgi:hypothetical protein
MIKTSKGERDDHSYTAKNPGQEKNPAADSGSGEVGRLDPAWVGGGRFHGLHEGIGPPDRLELAGYRTLAVCFFFPHPEFQEVDPLQQYHCIHEHFFFPWNRQARDQHNVTDWAQWGWSLGMWFHHYRFINAERGNRGID